MLVATSIINPGWFSQKNTGHNVSKKCCRSLQRVLYAHNACVCVNNKKVSMDWDQLQVVASQSLLQTCDKYVTYTVYAFPSLVPRLNHHCSHFFLTLGYSIYLPCFGLAFVFDALVQTQTLVLTQWVLNFCFAVCFLMSLTWNSQFSWPRLSSARIKDMHLLSTYTTKLEPSSHAWVVKSTEGDGREGNSLSTFSASGRRFTEPASSGRVLISSGLETLENAVSSSLSGTNSMTRAAQMVSNHMKTNQKMSMHSFKC